MGSVALSDETMTKTKAFRCFYRVHSVCCVKGGNSFDRDYFQWRINPYLEPRRVAPGEVLSEIMSCFSRDQISRSACLCSFPRPLRHFVDQLPSEFGLGASSPAPTPDTPVRALGYFFKLYMRGFCMIAKKNKRPGAIQCGGMV